MKLYSLAVPLMAGTIAAAVCWQPSVKTTVEPGLQFHCSEIDLGNLPAGSHDVRVRIVNSAAHDAKVIGIGERCDNNCCYGATCPFPVIISAHSESDFTFKLIVREPGPFSAKVVIFLDDAGLRQLILHARGYGMDLPEDGPNEAQTKH